MIETRWTRLVGVCALAALVLQGVGVPGQLQDAGLQDHWVLCHLPLLLPDLPAGEPPILVVTGYLSEEPGPPVAAAHRSCAPSRGPPA